MHLSSSAQHSTAISIDWEIAAELPPSEGQQIALGLAGPVVGISDQKLIVGGGANFPDSMPWLGGKKKYYDALYVFEKDEKGKIRLNPHTFHLTDALAYSANVSTPDGIIAAGGENQGGISQKVLLLKWKDESKSLDIQQLPEIPIALTNAAIAADGPLVYLAGGETPEIVSSKFYCLNLRDLSSGWQELPNLPKPVSHAVMVVQSNGKEKGVYLIGGRKRNGNGISDLYASVFCFDLKKKKWVQKKSLPYALSAGTGIATADFSILIFGGDRGETFHKTEELIAKINWEDDETKKQQLISQKAQLQASHPGFSNAVLEYDVRKNQWKLVGSIPFPVPATTTAVKWGNDIVIPSGEIKAGVRTPNILVGKPRVGR